MLPLHPKSKMNLLVSLSVFAKGSLGVEFSGRALRAVISTDRSITFVVMIKGAISLSNAPFFLRQANSKGI